MNQLKSYFTSPIGMAMIGCSLIVAIGIGFSQLSDDILPDDVIDSPSADLRDQPIEVGGIIRPRADIEGISGLNGMAAEATPESEPEVLIGVSEAIEKGLPIKSSYGTTPLIPPSESKVVKATYDALMSKDEKSDRAYNPFAQLDPFDEAAYRANPDAYIGTVEPARVWQSAQPGAGVPQLKRIGVPNPVIVQGESIRLQVQSKPGAPVSYMSFDMGAFENRLAAITVASDENGLATAEFTGPPGTINNVRVVAASPLASGNTEFMVRVLPSGSTR